MLPESIGLSVLTSAKVVTTALVVKIGISVSANVAVLMLDEPVVGDMLPL